MLLNVHITVPADVTMFRAFSSVLSRSSEFHPLMAMKLLPSTLSVPYLESWQCSERMSQHAPDT